MNSFSYKFVKAVERYVGVYWLHKDICDHAVCNAEISGRFIFGTAHLSKEGSEFLGISNHWFDNMSDLIFQFDVTNNLTKLPQTP